MVPAHSILIVEDEAMIALSLTLAVEDAGGVVVGPVASVGEALEMLEYAWVTGAVIDAQLVDRDATPVAIRLIERSLPFVVHTGTGLPRELAAMHPDLPLVMKPTSADRVVAQLLAHTVPAGRPVLA